MLDLLVGMVGDNQSADQHSENLLVSEQRLRVAALLKELVGILRP